MGAAEHLARRLVRSFLFVVTGGPLVGWWLMLLMGILHHEIHAAIPTIGYWPSVFVIVLAKPVVVYVVHPSKATIGDIKGGEVVGATGKGAGPPEGVAG